MTDRDRRRRTLRRHRMLALGALAAAIGAGVVVAGAGGGGDRRPAPRALAAAVAPRRPGAGGPHRASRRASRTVSPSAGIAPARAGRARVVVSGSRLAGLVALTFDDGFCRACVARIVDVLWRTGVHATFFPNGIYAASWAPQARRIRRMIARGQVLVGNHTFAHHDAQTESSALFAADLAQNERWIERTFRVTGRPWFRPPYGAYNASTLAVAGVQGYRRVILWSGTLADSQPRTIPYLLKATRDWGHPGAIILAHANYPNTGRALPRIIRLLAQRHLRSVTLAELPGAVAGAEGTPNSASPAIPAL